MCKGGGAQCWLAAKVGRSGPRGPWGWLARADWLVLCWLSSSAEDARSTYRFAQSLPAGVQATVGGVSLCFSVHMNRKAVSGLGLAIMPVCDRIYHLAAARAIRTRGLLEQGWIHVMGPPQAALSVKLSCDALPSISICSDPGYGLHLGSERPALCLSDAVFEISPDR